MAEVGPYTPQHKSDLFLKCFAKGPTSLSEDLVHLLGFSSGLLQKSCVSWSRGGDQDRQLLLVPFQMTQMKSRQISFFSIFERELIPSLKARGAALK